MDSMTFEDTHKSVTWGPVRGLLVRPGNAELQPTTGDPKAHYFRNSTAQSTQEGRHKGCHPATLGAGTLSSASGYKPETGVEGNV